jgi:hypothetical protein
MDPSGHNKVTDTYYKVRKKLKDKVKQLYGYAEESVHHYDALVRRGVLVTDSNDVVLKAGALGKYWNAKAKDYAKNQLGTSVYWDNKADAYRHFSLSFELTRAVGKKAASIIMYNHELETSGNYNILSNVNGNIKMSVRLSTLMDLNNNNEGIYLAGNNGYSASSGFQFALSEGALITSLDQVAAAYGFDSSLIYTGADGQQYVNVSFTAYNGSSLSLEDFMYYNNWSFVN